MYSSPIFMCRGKKKAVSFKTVLGEVVKILISLNLNPWVQVFLIFCDEMGRTFKALLLHTKVWQLSQGKALVCVQGPPFLPKRMRDERVFQVVYLADIVLNINEGSLWLPGKQLTIFTANNKIKAFKSEPWQLPNT